VSLESGQIVDGKYRITRLLGEGGMGAVFEGENIRIRRKVAIKVLHAAFTENQEVVQRFEREAQAAGHIGNDHILEVLDLGQLENGDLYLVMEYLDGEALSDRVRRLGRMSPEQIVPLMLEVLEGLAAAHAAGIIHRDLKPDNIFIVKEKAGQKDFVKIIDFGISKFQPLSGDGMKMTKTGAMMGTPYYMSPEQATGSRETDQRSDIYALGVIVYECVTGTVPFDAPSFNQLLFKIALTTPPPLEQVIPDLDPGFCSIVAKAMAREVETRFATCEDFSAALVEWTRTRAGVSVPPPPSEAAMHAEVTSRASEVAINVPPGSLPKGTPASSVPGGAATAGSWTTEQTDTARSKAPFIAAAAAALVLVLGGGAFALFGSADDAKSSPAGAPDERSLATQEAIEAAKRAEAEAEAIKKTAEEEKRAAAEAAKKAEEAAKRVEARVDELTRKAEARAEADEAAAKAKTAVRTAVRPSTASLKPAAAAAPAPAPKPAPGGEPDFGY
jgi:eukaryotic-like serine/threonine-protein kinase